MRRGKPLIVPAATYSYGDGKVSAQALASDWSSFAAKMPLQLRSLEQAGVQYRLAPPGARVVERHARSEQRVSGATHRVSPNNGRLGPLRCARCG